MKKSIYLLGVLMLASGVLFSCNNSGSEKVSVSDNPSNSIGPTSTSTSNPDSASVSASNSSESRDSVSNSTKPSDSVSSEVSAPTYVEVESGDVVFTNNAYVRLDDMPERLHIKMDTLEETNEIEYIDVGNVRINNTQCSYKNNILSIDTRAFVDNNGKSKIKSGDQTVKIRFKNATKIVEINILFVDKVITTADELQSINENPSGSYILGNDIDCSEISNFEPLGYTATSSVRNKEFLGVFDGNGFAIKNLTSRYSLDITSEKDAKKNNAYLFESESHQSGDQFGVFQNIGSTGVVRNTSFKNVNIYGRTISGVICGLNEGTIENCFIDEDSSATISTHFYDETCNVGAIAGLVGASGVVRNCISLAKCYILDSFAAYGDEYIEGNRGNYGDNATEDQLRTWYFWGGTKGDNKLDSNGVETNGVYAGAGMVYGHTLNSYCLSFMIENESFAAQANFGQTHKYENKTSDGPDVGSMVNCLMKTEEELKTTSLYDTFNTELWDINENEIPTLKEFYAFEIIL